MKEAEANPATTAKRLLDAPPIPQARAEAKRVSERFEKALDAMFFENALLGPLTRKYGVF